MRAKTSGVWSFAHLARTIKFYVKNPRQLYQLLAVKGLLNWVPDSTYLKIIFFLTMGKRLNINEPHTFSEKLQWLKLHDRNNSYTQMVDKYTAKQYVANLIGQEYIIPLLGVWNHFDDIDFSALPNSFVLKCTHDSGGLIIVRDKSKLDLTMARKKINRSMSTNYYWMSREWPYKNVKPRIIAEQYMANGMEKDLNDYKFYCFNGCPQYCQVICNRSTNETIDFFDMNWEHQQFTGLEFPYRPPISNSSVPIPMPVNFDKMKMMAEKLAENIPFVRVDFYEVSGHMYFGELTFFPLGGFGGFSPSEWDLKIGHLLHISSNDVESVIISPMC